MVSGRHNRVAVKGHTLALLAFNVFGSHGDCVCAGSDVSQLVVWEKSCRAESLDMDVTFLPLAKAR